MKRSFWYGIVGLLLAGPVHAQSVTGVWQGVETDTGEPGANWPAVLRLQKGKGTGLFGVLYQEVGGQPGTSVTFQVQGTPTAKGVRIEHGRKLNETGGSAFTYWCDGAITFTYDPALEKLTGKAAYRPVGDCDVGTFTFYRVKLKSAATVAAGVETTIRVTGRNVLWYADAELKQPVTTGNTYRTKLAKTTTFYLAQGYYPTKQSPVVPITIRVTGSPPAPKATPPVAATPPPAPTPTLPPLDTARPAPAPTPVVVAPTPVVLPTVLFKLGTAELLTEGVPALHQLAAELKARPTLRVRISGHTDKIGEPEKNQALSEQRAEAVKAFLVKDGIAAERISTAGYGDTRPLYASPDARNRRVEVEEVK
ncbi:OmpA family protein [Hymenobacter chitinivorans]|uniref:Outer membrane protein OmpA-like peptidoglycan-associated protein n=1 Tax=Hymenobacter chitinivorans DSM 11115 TaxID=1121954 RepID=A0A2M9BQQ3_9BACT|nr:OmpA family protein [Hymenobacter chitinivorans]PJJ60274.1 outer membrane protein OmpA-like peptidoglycan-associated protein [Hymenobacter chitinivorans DSM 11115]